MGVRGFRARLVLLILLCEKAKFLFKVCLKFAVLLLFLSWLEIPVKDSKLDKNRTVDFVFLRGSLAF